MFENLENEMYMLLDFGVMIKALLQPSWTYGDFRNYVSVRKNKIIKIVFVFKQR